ncbi:MAG: ATP-grasp domain-containing protein [Bacteroidales bacterium]|nr:ATP-grasp domain-containing protein [Bacteroidales bacterium]
MDRFFVLLGANKLLWGQVCHLRELGYKVIVVAWNEHPDITGDEYIRLDVKDSAAIISELERRGYKGRVFGALSSIDLAAPAVNAINAWCGNKTMPDKFNKVLSKNDMRESWMAAGLFNRISLLDGEKTMDEIFALSAGMKLICKPDVSASSRGITILEKGCARQDLEAAVELARETSFNHRYLIEEFVEGEEFTVDMLGDAYGNVNCYASSIQHHSLYALHNHVTVIHHWNSRKYDDATWNRIADFGIKCYKALGLHSMFGHLEIIMKEDGTFTPVEMGARSSGFICSHTVWKASGHDYLGDYVKMLHGGTVEPGNYLNGADASMWFGYDIPSGTDSVKETDITRYLDPGINVLFENHDGLKAGQHFGDYINDGDRDKFGYAILSGPRDVLTYESVQKSNERFLDDFLGRRNG